MKRVLLLAFDFPPRRTSGVYRPTGLAKYLPQFGWEPTVLTVRGGEGNTEDSTLLERLPSQVRVVRTRYLHVNGWEKHTAKTLLSLGNLRPLSTNNHQPTLERCLRALGRWMRACLYFPDATIGWIPFATAKAIQLHCKRRYDAVYTTSPPRSTQVVGLLLKILLDVPWVAEFRDPWVGPPDLRELFGESAPVWRNKSDHWICANILRHADALVAVTHGIAEELRSEYHLGGDKLSLVNNGFDEDDFNASPGENNDVLAPGYLHLSHFGTVYPGFSGSFFPALAALLRERPEAKDRLRINIFGFPDEDVRRSVATEELQGVVKLHGFLRHADAIQAMRASHCLLLFYGHPYNSRVTVPGKIYEFLRVGRPVLAVAFEGGVKTLIEQGNAGWVLRPDNIEGIKQVLRMLLDTSCNAHSAKAAEAEFAAQFRYDRLAAKLARVFNHSLVNAH